MNKFTKLITTLALSAVAGTVSAGIISGELIIKETDFAQATPINLDADTSTAEAIEFSCVALSPECTATNEGTVQLAIGGFAAIMGDSVDFSDFTFDALVAGTTLWTITDAATSNIWTLKMNAVTIHSQLMTNVNLDGTGEFTVVDTSGNLLDTAFGNWTFQTSTSGSLFSFDSTAAPEPAITLLLATGLIGFGFARRVRKAA